MTPFTPAHDVVVAAIASRVFPGAVVEVGTTGGPLWSDAFGSLTFELPQQAVSVSTPFDLASLTKPIATTSVVMELVERGALRLDERLADLFPEWIGADRATATIRDLLEHASGLPARLVDAPPRSRREFEHEICRIPLEYVSRAQSVYTDIGFVLLGFAVTDRGGAPLDVLFDRVMERTVHVVARPFHPSTSLGVDLSAVEGQGRDRGAAASGKATASPPELQRRRESPALQRLSFGAGADAAPTDPLADDWRRGRRLVGEVHDNYAAALGGVAGHAGLFGTAAAVGAFARILLRAARRAEETPAPFTPELVARFIERSEVPGSSRALGWDTMLPTSSCGTRMSAAAFGHVGYTGTSLWIDPARNRYFVLLTNRACGGGTLEEMREVRRAFHDALADA